MEEFIWPVSKGGARTWSSNDVDVVSVDPISVLQGIEELILSKIPKTCNLKSLSKAPGTFVPDLRAILAEYEQQHLEYSVAMYVSDLDNQKTEKDRTMTITLPKLFAPFPIPSLKWRFVELNSNALRTLLSIYPFATSYEENRDLFNNVFDLERYGFDK
jgi:hypothetical protein